MLKIRAEQMEVLADVSFVMRLGRRIRQRHGMAEVRLPTGRFAVGELSDAELKAMVRVALHRGRRHGLMFESALASFAVLMFIVAPNFDEDPFAATVLEDRETGVNLRVEKLLEMATDNDWDRMRERYNRNAWTAPTRSAQQAD